MILKKNKYGYLIISRLNSKRLKNKAQLKIANKTIIEIIILRLLKITSNQNIVICTSKNKNNFYRNLTKKYNLQIYEGDEKNILQRIDHCIKKFNYEYVFRLTGDNPFVDLEVIKKIRKISNKKYYDYYYCNSIPRGTRCELISRNAINKLNEIIIDKNSTEYLSYYFFRKDLFTQKILKLKKNIRNEQNISFSIDKLESYLTIKKMIKNLKNNIYINRIKLINEFKKLSSKEKKVLNTNQIKFVKVKTTKYDVRVKNDMLNLQIKSLY